MTNEEKAILLAEFEPMFKEAEEKGLWLYCGYQELWFSPKELKDAHAEGRFIWGVVNFKLRDPNDELTRMNTMIENTKKNIESFKKRMV